MDFGRLVACRDLMVAKKFAKGLWRGTLRQGPGIVPALIPSLRPQFSAVRPGGMRVPSMSVPPTQPRGARGLWIEKPILNPPASSHHQDGAQECLLGLVIVRRLTVGQLVPDRRDLAFGCSMSDHLYSTLCRLRPIALAKDLRSPGPVDTEDIGDGLGAL